MSTENNTSVDLDMDLDDFSAEFFGQKEAQPEPASSEESKEPVEQESDATKEDTHTEGDDTPDTEDKTEEDEGEDDKSDEPKPKKNRAQERIEELNKKYREEQRAREALEERLAKLEQNGKDEPAPKQEAVVNKGPTPDDKNEDGTDKYPLGEFDPGFIRDLTRFTLEEERNAIKAKEDEEKAQRQEEEQRIALQSNWQEKIGPAQERYPDFQEKGEQLLETFEGIDQAYGEYLTATLMAMDFGPDVLYYLANNVDEAQKIVNSGPTKATIALGRLEAKFALADEEKQKARPKVSQAPTPPPTNKGAAPALADIPADTDDLDAFSSLLFKKRR